MSYLFSSGRTNDYIEMLETVKISELYFGIVTSFKT